MVPDTILVFDLHQSLTKAAETSMSLLTKDAFEVTLFLKIQSADVLWNCTQTG